MAEGSLLLTSSSDIVGYEKDDNELTMKFIPASPLAPTGEGLVHLSIPYWYYINNGAKSKFMYDENAENECISDELNVVASNFRSGNLRILWTSISPDYVPGNWISITCKGFRNPIHPGQWSGFQLKVFDFTRVHDDKFANTITLTGDVAFNADYFKPAIVPP